MSQTTNQSAVVSAVNEMLPPGRLFALGAQHLLAMYASIAATPLVLAVALKLPQDQVIYLLSVTAFTCGLATLLQSVGVWKIGSRLPIVQGTTFTSVAPMILIGGQWGWPAIFGSVIASGLFTFLLAPYFSRLLRFFPPVVTGTTLTAIGVTLMPVAVLWMNGGDMTTAHISGSNLALAGVTLVIVLAIYHFCKGFLGRIAVLAGLVLGTLIAWIFGLVNFDQVASAKMFELVTPFHFGMPTFEIAAVLSMCLVMLITMVETTSDVLAIGDIAGEKIDSKLLASALRADGAATFLGGILNSFPYTAYAQNVGLIRLTGVKSRWAIAMAGVLLVIMGLLPKISAVVASIPLPVLGGAALVLFGGVAATGIKILGSVDLDNNRNLLIVAVSLGMGMIPVSKPGLFGAFPPSVQIIFDNGIILACLSAILLNMLFNVLCAEREPTEQEDAPQH